MRTTLTSAAMLLSKHGALAGSVAHRMAFKTAWNDGRTALETEPRGKAAEEVRELWAYVGEAIGLVAVTRKEKAYV